MRLFTTNEIDELPKRLTLINAGKEYSVQLRDTAKSGADWWGITLPHPLNWLRSIRLNKPKPMKVLFLQDAKLDFEHLIIVPVHVQGQEPATYKIPSRTKGGKV